MTAKHVADEYPRPAISHRCWKCNVSAEDVSLGRVIVSPTGTAHHADGDRTECGHDATGDKWWWPL